MHLPGVVTRLRCRLFSPLPAPVCVVCMSASACSAAKAAQPDRALEIDPLEHGKHQEVRSLGGRERQEGLWGFGGVWGMGRRRMGRSVLCGREG